MLSDEPTSYPPLGQVAVAASPRGHVRVWVAGLTATQSLVAAEEALAGSPAQIVGQTLHSADLQVGRLSAVLARVEIDLILLVGGYDYPGAEAQEPLYELSRVFATVLARTPPPQRPHVLFAGNRWAAAGAAEIFHSMGAGAVEAVENVCPAPGVLHRVGLVQAVNFAYWRLCRRSEGMREISRWMTAPGHISSIESSFAQLVQVWMEHNGLPDLHAPLLRPRLVAARCSAAGPARVGNALRRPGQQAGQLGRLAPAEAGQRRMAEQFMAAARRLLVGSRRAGPVGGGGGAGCTAGNAASAARRRTGTARLMPIGSGQTEKPGKFV